MMPDIADFFQLIPQKSLAWETDPQSGFIIIKKPKFQNKLLKKYLLPHLKRPDFRINLDEIGSFVWNNIDGRSSLYVIAGKMQKEFTEKVEPVEERLGQFVRALYRNKFIFFVNRTAE
jgi:hypothetical protein